MTGVLLLILLVFLLAVGTPIAFGIGIVAVAGIVLSGVGNPAVVAQRAFAGINSYPLLALPLFVLAGNLLVSGGIIHRLVSFADLVVGRLRGGLAQVNIVSNLMMAGISGSATADTAALGSVMVPMMEAKAYPKPFAAALTTSAAIVAPIIPPSLVMVIYAIPTRLSIGAMFMAGIVPGLIVTALFMAYVAFATRHREPDAAGLPKEGTWRPLLAGLPVLGAPVIIVGGVRGGVFTATEAAAVLVGYVLFLTLVVYRSLNRARLIATLRESALTTAVVMFVVATSTIFAWYLAIENVPGLVRDLFVSLTDDTHVFLVLVNIFLLIVGCFVDTVPAILIFVPILQPAAAGFGIDPIHFSIIVILNLMVGLNTPPIGTNLFVISSVAKLRIGQVAKALIPFFMIKLVALGIITYIPFLSLALPRAMGLIR